MPRLTTHTDIDRSVPDVFRILRNVPGYAGYFHYITSASVLDETRDTVTADITEEVHGIKQQARVHFRFQAPNRVLIQQIRGPFRSATAEFLLEPRDGMTRLHHTIDFKVKGGLLSGMVQRAVAGSLIEMKMQEEVAAIKRAAEQNNHR